MKSLVSQGHTDNLQTEYDKHFSMKHDFNFLSLKLQITLEEEEHNRIKFLDIIVPISDNNLNFNIYRKPAPADCIIPFDSCRPLEHKTATTR